MTERSAEKRSARNYARINGVSYRTALAAVRDRQAGADCIPFARRLLIEAVEGCGIRHWARVVDWDGIGCLTVTDLGGETYRLTADQLAPVLATYRDAGTIAHPLDIDSYVADDVIQAMLFGCTIYRSEVRKRPAMAS